MGAKKKQNQGKGKEAAATPSDASSPAPLSSTNPPASGTAAGGEDDWVDIDKSSPLFTESANHHADGSSPNSTSAFHEVDKSQWLKDKDVSACMNCGGKFSLLKRQHHCRKCGKIYCENCCKSSNTHNHQRICIPCIKAEAESAEAERVRVAEEQRIEQERQATLIRIGQEIMLWQDSEEKERKVVEDLRTKQIEKVISIAKEEQGKIRLLEEERKKAAVAAEAKEEKGGIVDKWRTVKGPRAGNLNLTVARAQGLVPPRLLLTCSSAVLIQYHFQDEFRPPIEFETATVRNDASPEYDFECYFAVEDDTLPVLFYVRDYTVGYPLRIASSRLNLRGDYKNLVRTVTKEGVYVEKGHAILDCWLHDKILPDTFLTVHWTLELREINKTKFCPDCGLLEFRCSCEPAVRDARREREAKEWEAKSALILEAKEQRHAEEARLAEEEARKRREAAEKAFKKAEAELEAQLKQGVLDITLEERRVWERVDKALRDSFHEARVKEEARAKHTRQLKECLAVLARNENVLLTARYGDWKAFMKLQKETKRKLAEDSAAAALIEQRRRRDNELKAQADADERLRQKNLREEKYQDEKLEEGQFMVNGVRTQGRPRPEVHHDEEKRTQSEAKKTESGGCCTIS